MKTEINIKHRIRLTLAINLLRRSSKKMLRRKRKTFLSISNIDVFKNVIVIGAGGAESARRAIELYRSIKDEGAIIFNDINTRVPDFGKVEKIKLMMPERYELCDPVIFKEKRDHKQERYRANQYRK